MKTISITSILLSSYAVFDPAYAADDSTSLAFDPKDTAVVIIDPQNDFLSTNGLLWELVSESATENDTVQNIEMLFKAAQDNDFLVFISPHYYYPHDMGWLFEGKGEAVMHSLGTFVRTDQLSEEGFEGSGADWLEQYKPYIAEDNVIVSSPHKVYGPEQNDLVLQMRKKKIDRVILGGMSANLCVESHMRELIEQGFEVHVVKDATAGARDPDLGDGYAAALTNFKYIANGVLTTDEAISAMGADADEIAVAIDRREGEEVEIETESNGAARL